jgi:hypothetical protein
MSTERITPQPTGLRILGRTELATLCGQPEWESRLGAQAGDEAVQGVRYTPDRLGIGDRQLR